MVHYDFLTMVQVPLQVVRTWHCQLPSAWRRFASYCVPRLLPRPLVVPRSLALTMRSSLLDNGNAEVWHDLASSLPSIAARFVLPLQPLSQELPVMVICTKKFHDRIVLVLPLRAPRKLICNSKSCIRRRKISSSIISVPDYRSYHHPKKK